MPAIPTSKSTPPAGSAGQVQIYVGGAFGVGSVPVTVDPATGVATFGAGASFVGNISAANLSGINTGDQTLGGLGGAPLGRTISTTLPITGGGDLSANRTIAMAQAATAVDGYLSHADWNTFNGKAPSASPTFTGTVTLQTVASSGSITQTYAPGSGNPTYLNQDGSGNVLMAIYNFGANNNTFHLSGHGFAQVFNTTARFCPFADIDFVSFATRSRFGDASCQLTGSSGTDNQFVINPNYNQTSTAGGADLLINRVETAIGSGTHRLIDAQVGGSSKFNVDRAGVVTATGQVLGFGKKTANYTATLADTYIVCDATSAAITITLPAACNVAGHAVWMKKIDASHTVSISVTGSVDGSSPPSLTTQNQIIRLVSDGANWYAFT